MVSSYVQVCHTDPVSHWPKCNCVEWTDPVSHWPKCNCVEWTVKGGRTCTVFKSVRIWHLAQIRFVHLSNLYVIQCTQIIKVEMSQQDTVSGQLNYPCPETDHNQIWLLPKNDFSPKDGGSPENGFLQKNFACNLLKSFPFCIHPFASSIACIFTSYYTHRHNHDNNPIKILFKSWFF